MLATLPWENQLKTKLTLLHNSENNSRVLWAMHMQLKSQTLCNVLKPLVCFQLGHKVSFSDKMDKDMYIFYSFMSLG